MATFVARWLLIIYFTNPILRMHPFPPIYFSTQPPNQPTNQHLLTN